MKYIIKNYDEYLNLSLKDIEQITDDFDLYTDQELGIMDGFNSQFQVELNNILKKQNNINKLVVEDFKQLLTDEQFYNWPQRKILLYFGGKL